MRIRRVVNFNAENIAVFLDELLIAVERSEVNLLEFTDHRIYRVCARACVVECPFRHLIYCIEEFLFPIFCALFRMSLAEPVADCRRDTDVCLQLFKSIDPVVEGFFVVLALYADQLAQLNVSLECLRILVLRERTHVVRVLLRVELADIRCQQSVCSTVRYVEPAAQLVGQGVVDAQERVCECNACQCGSVCHLFTCNRIWLSILECGLVSSREILEYHLDCGLCKSIRVFRCESGYVCFYRVGEYVVTGSLSSLRRQLHHVVGIYDSHFRHHFVTDDRPLHAGVRVGNDRERSNLGTRTSRSRDADQLRLLAHLREETDSLSDIEEDRSHVEESFFRIFVHDPHDLRSIDCGTAADSDDNVRLEFVHLREALHRILDLRVNADVEEFCSFDTHVS